MQTQSSAAGQKRLAREYELVYILQSNVDPDDAEKVAQRVQEVVAKLGGKITKVDNWGRRKLAYPIKKASRGVFIYVKFVGFSDLVAEIERNLRNFDAVVRFQTVRREGVFELHDVAVDPEETKWARVEAPPTEEEPEPSFEERLGLTAKPPREDELSDLDDDDMAGELPPEVRNEPVE
jgi:small subunit ribosomal protein S6